MATEILTEASLNKVREYIAQNATGAITGFRGENTFEVNKKLNRQILAYLLGKGYTVFKVKGSYIENYKTDKAKEVSEDSFFVVNANVMGDDNGKLEEDLVKLGQAYHQDSILSIPFNQPARLIGTSRDPEAFIPFGGHEPVGKPVFGKASGQFFSRVGGRKFAFETHITEPDTINGKRAMSIYESTANDRIKKL